MAAQELHNEKQLFQRIAEGDREAFSVVFRHYFDRLYWNAYKLLKSEFWAEEIVQVAFTQLWLNRSGLHLVEHPSAYLYRVVTNKARDQIRKHEREVKLQYYIALQESFATSQVPDTIHKLQDLLEKAVNSLPPQRKQVYILKYQQGLSYDDIASQLSVSKHTIRNHMAKALEDIRVYLLKHADFISLLPCLYFL